MPVPPGDPGYYDKVNYVITSWSTPCDAPWYIYIETLWPAALEAFLVLITFGWDDVLRGFWRPRGLGRRTGKRKGKGRGRRFPRFPELGDLIGSNLPGADKVKGRKWGAGGKALWRIDTLLQRGLFYWLIADVTIDFAYNWTSLLYKTTWCQASDVGRFSYTNPGPFLRPGHLWTFISEQFEDYQEGDCFYNGNDGNAGHLPCMVTCAGRFEEWSGVGLPTEIGFRILDLTDGKIIATTGIVDPEDAAEPNGAIGGEVPAGHQFQAQSWHNATGAFIVDMIIAGAQVKR